MPDQTPHADALRAAGHPEAAELVEKLDAQNLVDTEAPAPGSITALISEGIRLRREDTAA